MQSKPAIAHRASVNDLQITVNGVQLHYRDWGEPTAPALLMIHGSGLTARANDALAGGLADRYRVLALDMRGHGESGRASSYEWQQAHADVHAFVDALRLSRLSLLGHSMGARIATVHAARHPDAVDALVLIDWVPGATFTPEYRQALGQLFGMARIDDPEAVLQGARSGQPRLREDAFRHVITSGLVRRPDGDGWAWRLDPEVLRGREQAFPIDHGTTTRLLGQVRCPTLIVRAADSQYVTHEQAEQAARTVRNGTMVEIPQAGHGLPWEQPERLLDAARAFLAQS